MSSVNTVFQPMGPTQAVVSGAPVQGNPTPSGNTGDCFRIVNTTTTNGASRVQWGRTSAGTPVPTVAAPNNMYLAPNESIYLCLPADSWFNCLAASTIEVTPGQGGAGG
jgi:hypothetical protein